MRLKIADPKELHSILEKAYLLEEASVLEVEGEGWRHSTEEKKTLENLKKNTGYDFHSIGLPHPLDEISVEFQRAGKYYYGIASLSVRNQRAFRSLSSKLEKTLAKKGLLFFPTTSYGSGHICNEEKIPLFSILETNSKTHEIGFGVYGSIPREFRDFDNFLNDISHFESIINLYVGQCRGIDNPEKTPTNPTLYFV